MDPFFVAQRNFSSNGGWSNSYLHDVNTTYGGLPKRDPLSFAKALRFREEEKRRIEALAQENEEYANRAKRYESKMSEAAKFIKGLTETVKVLRKERDESTVSSSSGSVRDVDAQHVRGEEGGAATVQREGVRADAASVGGHSTSHAAEGRQSTDDGGGPEPEDNGRIQEVPVGDGEGGA